MSDIETPQVRVPRVAAGTAVRPDRNREEERQRRRARARGRRGARLLADPEPAGDEAGAEEGAEKGRAIDVRA